MAGESCVRIQLSAAPLATLISHYDAAQGRRLTEAIARDGGAALAPYASGDHGLAFPQEVHVVLASS